jgi:alcohol dehydrogenase
MKALVYKSPRHLEVENVDDPVLQNPRDAIVRVTSTAICGSDLHIYNGFFPQLKDFVLGHEFMGVVEEVGADVKRLARGDRVFVPFPIACGQCWFCAHELPVHCERSNPDYYGPEGGVMDQKGGGLFGYTKFYGDYDGGQAELVRVPFADVSPRLVPEGLADEQVLFLTDIFPTGWAAIDWAELKGGETVAVFGCGPVGLMAQKAAWLQGAGRVIGVDLEGYRVETARSVAKSEGIDASEVDPVERIRELTDGRGADVCVDAVGMESDRTLKGKLKAAVHLERGSIDVLRKALSAVRRGGTVTIVGVYPTPYDNFPLSQIFDKGLKLRAGQCPVTQYVDQLLELVRDGRVALDDIITHVLPLSEAANAYKLFDGKEDGCVKVVLKP